MNDSRKNNIMIWITIAVVILFQGCKIGSGQNYYTNPLDVRIADPLVIKDNGTYYLYGTNASDRGFETWTSIDLVNWQYRGFVFEKTADTWSQGEFWAPEVIKRGENYYLFYSASSFNTGKRICVARGSSPLGPFKEISAPMFATPKAVIDAHPFIDDDGKAYLYYVLDMSENKISEIYVVELEDSMTEVKGQSTFCIRPSQQWEGTVWNEAPFVISNDGMYYLMYSANCFVDPYYGIGYATSTSPKGPWEKYEGNPILRKTDQVSGPGHNCVIDSPDGAELFVVYHRHISLSGGGPREIAIDRIGFEKSNNQTILKVKGPTSSPAKYPSTNGK